VDRAGIRWDGLCAVEGTVSVAAGHCVDWRFGLSHGRGRWSSECAARIWDSRGQNARTRRGASAGRSAIAFKSWPWRNWRRRKIGRRPLAHRHLLKPASERLVLSSGGAMIAARNGDEILGINFGKTCENRTESGAAFRDNVFENNFGSFASIANVRVAHQRFGHLRKLGGFGGFESGSNCAPF
jgi:hypothetical protein